MIFSGFMLLFYIFREPLTALHGQSMLACKFASFTALSGDDGEHTPLLPVKSFQIYSTARNPGWLLAIGPYLSPCGLRTLLIAFDVIVSTIAGVEGSKITEIRQLTESIKSS